MIFKKININDILEFLGEKVLQVHGSTQDVFIDNLAEIERVIGAPIKESDVEL